jgi:hypothetical protein
MLQAVVAGSARCLWDDLSRVPADLPIFAVNFAGLFIPRIDHLVSLHSDMAASIAALRRMYVGNTGVTNADFAVHAPDALAGVDHARPVTMFSGTSSLYAVQVAFEMGYDRVILAGVPLDAKGAFYDPPSAFFNYGDYDTQNAWAIALPKLRGRVISCSGWTRSLLGEYQ